jgi:hypothetical protein
LKINKNLACGFEHNVDNAEAREENGTWNCYRKEIDSQTLFLRGNRALLTPSASEPPSITAVTAVYAEPRT